VFTTQVSAKAAHSTSWWEDSSRYLHLSTDHVHCRHSLPERRGESFITQSQVIIAAGDVFVCLWTYQQDWWKSWIIFMKLL